MLGYKINNGRLYTFYFQYVFMLFIYGPFLIMSFNILSHCIDFCLQEHGPLCCGCCNIYNSGELQELLA